MSTRNRYELERAAEACYRDLRQYDFLQTFTEASLLGFARWATGCSLNAQQLSRLIWVLGCHEISKRGDELAALIGAVNGASMATMGAVLDDPE